MGEILSVLLLVSLMGVMMLGFPVALSLAGVAIIFSGIGIATDVFDSIFLSAVPSRFFGVMTNEVLVAVPLFVFMGVMLERSQIADDLLTTMGQCFGKLRGGLAISVTLVGMVLAASTGIVGATVVTMGLLSLPTMLKAGYDPKVGIGTICASGTLGQIIPPSIALVILGEALTGAYSKAQLAKGNYLAEPFGVVDLFVGALIPGLCLVGLYTLWLIFTSIVWPNSTPAYYEADVSLQELFVRICKALLPPLVLVVAVLGAILGGVATPTEAASFGGVGAMLLAGTRRKLSLDVVIGVVRKTAQVSCMVFTILLGATMFALTFRGLGGDEMVHGFLSSLPGGQFGALLVIMIVMFLLGFVLDFIEIVFIVVPLVAPALFAFDIDPIWLGVMIAMNLQTSFLTPPFGWALFYIRGVTPDHIKTVQIYKGVIPFVGIQILGLAILWANPGLATWLPKVVFGG